MQHNRAPKHFEVKRNVSMHFWMSVKSKPHKSKSQRDVTSHPLGWLLSKKGENSKC